MRYNFTKEQLYELYVNQRMSAKKVGEQLGADRRVIQKYLIKFGIPRRSGIEAWQIRKENGEIISEEGKERRRQVHIGNKWAYKGGQEFDRYPDYNTYMKNRQIALERVGGICQICKNRKAIIAHHKDLTNWNHELENLLPLCRSCHGKLHWQIFREKDKKEPIQLELGV